MIDVLKIGKLIAEELIYEPGICLYPGAFKPPHIGHYEVAKDLASRVYITKVIVIISSKPRDGITGEDSYKVWKMFLEAEPNGKIEIRLSKEPTPIKDVFAIIENSPTDQPVYLAGGQSEVDDLGYFTSLQKTFDDKVLAIPVEEKLGRISASFVRTLLKSGDYTRFEEALPKAVINKGYGPEIFKMLTTSIKEHVITEEEDKIIQLPDTQSTESSLKRLLSKQGYDLINVKKK